jgi:phage/plasmid-associated DNA primase
VVSGWLDSDKEAESLLSHLATCLSPGWSVVKYVLLLGEGRNGKSLLLRMVEALFGRANVSSVTRQLMSAQNAAVLDLNGKLVNIVYDGMAEYVKDSGPEKSLIAGESIGIRRLFDSTLTMVQTPALFLEGLNREPKTSDKSVALQKRLVRYFFPNVYELDRRFEKRMLSERRLGAFLSLLVDRYVPEEDIAWRLAPTLKSIQLQMEAMHVNSQALQFLQYLEQKTPGAGAGIVTRWFEDVADEFRTWRQGKYDYKDWPDTEVLAQFKPFITTKRKSVRTPAGPRSKRMITSLTSETTEFLETLEGGDTDDDAAILDTLVDE